MSMYLMLVPVSAARTVIVAEDFTDDSGDQPADLFGADYRVFTAIAGERAAAETGDPGADWTGVFPAMARCLGHGCAEAGADLGYGPPFLIPAGDVAGVLAGLLAEGWCEPAEVATDGDSDDSYGALARMLSRAAAAEAAVAGLVT